MAEADDALTSRARARLGRVLGGRWTLDALLGVGAMAAVYAATHRNGSRVALKLLHPELSTDESLRARFLREGYVANRVGHPAAVRERSTTNEQLVAAATQPASPVAAALPDLDAAFAAWLDRALAFDPDARFASALEMRAALQNVVASLLRRGLDVRARFDGMPAPLAVQPRPPGDASATRRWAAAAVVLVTAGAIGLATRNALPPPSAATDSPVAPVPALDAAPASEPAASAALGEPAPTVAPSASAEPPPARRNLRVTAPPRRPPSRTWLDRRD